MSRIVPVMGNDIAKSRGRKKKQLDVRTMVASKLLAVYSCFLHNHPKRKRNLQVCLGRKQLQLLFLKMGKQARLPDSWTCMYCHQLFATMQQRCLALPDDDDPFFTFMEQGVPKCDLKGTVNVTVKTETVVKEEVKTELMDDLCDGLAHVVEDVVEQGEDAVGNGDKQVTVKVQTLTAQE